MRYSVKIFPGVRVYGGRSGYRRRNKSTAQPSGCGGIVVTVVLVVAAAYWLFGWPLLVLRHHWVSRELVNCATAVSCSGFKITGYQWQLVHRSGPTVVGVIVEVIWVALLLTLGLAVLVRSSAASLNRATSGQAPTGDDVPTPMEDRGTAQGSDLAVARIAVDASAFPLPSGGALKPAATAKLSGQNSKVLEVDLPGGRYRMSWTAVGSGYFGVRLEAEESSLLVNEVPPEPSSGETFVRLDRGRHIFSVEASNLNWTITFVPL